MTTVLAVPHTLRRGFQGLVLGWLIKRRRFANQRLSLQKTLLTLSSTSRGIEALRAYSVTMTPTLCCATLRLPRSTQYFVRPPHSTRTRASTGPD